MTASHIRSGQGPIGLRRCSRGSDHRRPLPRFRWIVSDEGIGMDDATPRMAHMGDGAPLTPGGLLARYEERLGRDPETLADIVEGFTSPEPRISDDPTAAALLRAAGPLVQAVAAVLIAHDPVGIVFEENPEEYEPEAETIALRLMVATGSVDGATALAAGFGELDVDDVRRIVHGDFVAWFSAEIAGPEERYLDIAREIRDLH